MKPGSVGSVVGCRVEDGVAVLSVDNPPLNLLTRQVRGELADHAIALAGREDVRAVVLTGAGDRAFSAGSDITEFPTTAPEGVERAQFEQECFAALTDLAQPLIAALHGHVLGGGLELALCADLRVADPGTVCGLPEATLGLLPCAGGTQRLTRLVGPGRAKTLLLTGRRISAATAARIGLVEELSAPGQALTAAIDLARATADHPPAAVQAIKHAVDAGADVPLVDGLQLEVALAGPLFGAPAANAARRRVLERREQQPHPQQQHTDRDQDHREFA